ncbi:hypothetical protein [Streptosporangium fragile]
MAVLTVAAVAAVLGGTVVGVQALTGSEGPADCPAAGCVAAATNQPDPEIDVTEPVDEPAPEEEPEEEPSTEETGGATEATDTAREDAPAPAPTATRRDDATPRPTPTEEPTRAPRVADDPLPTDEPEPSPSPTSQTLVGGHRTEAPSQPFPSETAPAPVQTSAPPPAGGVVITVGADLVQTKKEVYTVKLVVAADEAVTGLALSVPVGGEVTSVQGAEWSQDGETLTIESAEGLAAGEELVVNFTAWGAAEIPESCRSSQGECSVA